MLKLEHLLAQSKLRPLSASELGELADIYHTVRADRLAADKVAGTLKSNESSAEALLIEQMRSQEITACGGQRLRVALGAPDMVPAVKDWDKYYAYILETGDFSLLERRPGKAACRERWDDGQQIPGVEQFPVYKLSRNEVK